MSLATVFCVFFRHSVKCYSLSHVNLSLLLADRVAAMEVSSRKLQDLMDENSWLQQELSEESALRLAEEQSLSQLVSCVYEVENELSIIGRTSGNLRAVVSKLIKQTCQTAASPLPTYNGIASVIVKAILTIYSNQLNAAVKAENPPDLLMWFGEEVVQANNLTTDPDASSGSCINSKSSRINAASDATQLEPYDLYTSTFLLDSCPPYLEGRMSRLGIVEEVDEEHLESLSQNNDTDDDEDETSHVSSGAHFQIKCLLDELIHQVEQDDMQIMQHDQCHRKSSVDSAMSSGESSTCLLPLLGCLDSNYKNVSIQADIISSDVMDEIAKLNQQLALQSNELLLAKRRIEELSYMVTSRKTIVLQDELEAWKELVRHQKTLLVKITSELESTQNQLHQFKRATVTATIDEATQVDLESECQV